MVLALSVVRHAEEQFDNPVTTPLTGARCTIGRGQECDIVLEDATRHISRKHAAIVRQGEKYLLTVESRINPVILNGQPISAGQQAAVNLGDHLVIGQYEFSVVSAMGESPKPTTAAPDPFASLGRNASGPVDLDAIFGPTSARPAPQTGPGIDALFGTPSKPASDPLLDILGGGSEKRATPVAEPHAEDPLMGILGNDSSSSSATTQPSADDFLRGPLSAGSIDDLLGHNSGVSADPLGLVPEASRKHTDGAFGGGTGGSLEIDHVHDVHLPFTAPIPSTPPVRQAAPKPAPTQSPRSASSPPQSDVDPLAAFLGGELRNAGKPADDPLALFGGGSNASVDLPIAPQRSKEQTEVGANRRPATSSPIELSTSAPPAMGREPADDPLGLFGGGSNTKSAPDADTEPPRSEEMTGLSPFLPPGLSETVEPPAAAVAPARTAPPVSPTTTRSSPPPNPVPSGAPASMQGVISAFLEGAGMTDITIADAEADAFVRECGGTVRAAVEGIMGMLLARAKVKEELRASDRTMVASKENNALKLIETVDEALRYVFDPATRTEAFLPPPKAVADACSDLQAHEIALVAGMRAALIGAVKLFQPAVIEKKLEKAGGKSLLANKKALLWDQFVAHYGDLERDAEDNFDRVFGSAFLRAYQEQVRRLRG